MLPHTGIFPPHHLLNSSDSPKPFSLSVVFALPCPVPSQGHKENTTIFTSLLSCPLSQPSSDTKNILHATLCACHKQLAIGTRQKWVGVSYRETLKNKQAAPTHGLLWLLYQTDLNCNSHSTIGHGFLCSFASRKPDHSLSSFILVEWRQLVSFVFCTRIPSLLHCTGILLRGFSAAVV